MTERVAPTRMELLARRGQIALARQGRDLLKEKRNVLMKQFMKVAELVIVSSDELERLAAAARHALALAEAVEGDDAVRSASRRGSVLCSSALTRRLVCLISSIRRRSRASLAAISTTRFNSSSKRCATRSIRAELPARL